MEQESCLPDEFDVLRCHLAAIPDPRHARGKIHPLVGVLSLMVLALMAGARSMSAISRYGTDHPEVLAPLGLRRSPSVPTLSRLLRLVSVQEVRMALVAFTREVVARRQGAPGMAVVALDGKTLKGVWENGAQAHVLHVFAQQAAVALDQVTVASHLEEPAGAVAWLEEMLAQFPGLEILTGDALLADRDLCAAIVAAQRDYVVRLKKTSRPS